MGNAFNPNNGKIAADRSLEFETSMVYTASSRTAKATQKNSVLKNKTESYIKNMCLKAPQKLSCWILSNSVNVYLYIYVCAHVCISILK